MNLKEQLREKIRETSRFYRYMDMRDKATNHGERNLVCGKGLVHKTYIMGKPGAGKAGRALNPEMLISLFTSDHLLNICLRELKGDLDSWQCEAVSSDTILYTVKDCLYYLIQMDEGYIHMLGCPDSLKKHPELTKSLSIRQVSCGTTAIHCIRHREWSDAFQALMDCIDDDGNARKSPRVISVNEYALYISIIEMFICCMEQSGQVTTKEGR